MIKRLLYKIYSKEQSYALKWSLIGQILIRIINIFSAIVFARLLLPDEYGVYTYIIGSLVFIVNLVGLSIRTTSARNIAYKLQNNQLSFQRYFVVTLMIGNFLGVLGSVFTFFAIEKFEFNSITTIVNVNTLYLSSIAIWSELSFGFLMGILTGLKKFSVLNKLSIFSVLLKFTLSCLGYIFLDLNLAIILWVMASIISTCFSYLILVRYKKTYFRLKEKYNLVNLKHEIIDFFKLTIPISFEALFLMSTYWLIQTIIINNINGGKQDLAIYNLAYQWKSIGLYLPAIVINMLQPFFASNIGSGNSNETEKLFKNTHKMVVLISIAICLFLYGFSFFLPVIYGENYIETKGVLRILIISIVFVGLSNLIREFFIAHGKVWVIAVTNFIVSIMVVTSFFLFKEYFSNPNAYAMAVVIGELILFIVFALLYKRYGFKKR